MINDLKRDSARWEADVARRADLGHPRGSYVQDVKISHAPNSVPASYATSAIHEIRQQQGPSPPTFSATPAQSYPDAYSQSPYSGTQNAPYNNPSSYSSSHSPYGSGQAPYPPPQVSYSGPSQPVVTAADMHPTYTYSSSGYGGYEGGGGGGRNAPRYPGPGPGQAFDDQPDYSPATSGMAYPASTAPDPRIGMEARYTPEYERRGPQPTRERDPHRRR